MTNQFFSTIRISDVVSILIRVEFLKWHLFFGDYVTSQFEILSLIDILAAQTSD